MAPLFNIAAAPSEGCILKQGWRPAFITLRSPFFACIWPSRAERSARLNARIQSFPSPLDRQSFGRRIESNNPISCLTWFLLPLKGQKAQIQHTRGAGRLAWRLW